MIDIKLVSIPGGEFIMGSSEGLPTESPSHKVTVPSFYMSCYLITQKQWREVAALPPVQHLLRTEPSNFTGDWNPVEYVSWFEAGEFCARLSAHTGRTYRLPSEAEWEYACRAHTSTDNSFGVTLTKSLANFGYNYPGTTPVGTFPPNAFGLYDMHGNVYEWCQDHWHENYQKAPEDGSAWVDAEDRGNKFRVIRGCSWGSSARNCRAAFRNYTLPNDSDDYIGFRVVMQLN